MIASNGDFNRLQRVAAVCLVLATAGFLIYRALFDHEVPFLTKSGDADWILYPPQLSEKPNFQDINSVPVFRFSKDVRLDSPANRAVLHFKALRKIKLFINKIAIEEIDSSGSNWKKETRIDVTRFLKPGVNRIEAEVRNFRGPGLLFLYLEGVGKKVASDATWDVETDSQPQQKAVVADDTRRLPHPPDLPSPFQAAWAHKFHLVLLFLVSAGLTLWTHYRCPREWISRLPLAACVFISVLWAILFLGKFLSLPAELGFDWWGHLHYIQYLLTQGKTPLAHEGWSTYHPPLFYILSAGMIRVWDFYGGSSQTVPRLLTFFCGLGNIWIVYAMAQRIFRSSGIPVFFAVAFAAIVPMNIYMSAYMTNEVLNGFLMGLCLLATIRILDRSGNGPKTMWVLSLCTGLALITKFTAIAIVPVIFFFAACKLFLDEEIPPSRVLTCLTILFLGPLMLAGWFYLRNWIHFGQPLASNWNILFDGRLSYWQHPGYQTTAYYLGFGEVFVQPFFSGFHSFWDGLYSSFWGDGFLSGGLPAGDRNPAWNYEYVSLGYLLAAPATLIMISGFAKAIRIAVKSPERSLRWSYSFLSATIYLMLVLWIYHSQTAANFSTAKAFYGLFMVAPLSIVFALGMSGLHDLLAPRRFIAVRALLYGWFGTLAGVVYLSYAT